MVAITLRPIPGFKAMSKILRLETHFFLDNLVYYQQPCQFITAKVIISKFFLNGFCVHQLFYSHRSVLKYFNPESLMVVAMVFPFKGPFSNSIAAATLAPEENPAKMPSFLASSLAV